MNPDLQKELLSRLDALAQKLGVGSQYLWTLYQRQVKVEIIQDVMILAATILISCVLARVAVWHLKSDDYDLIWPIPVYIVGGIGELVLVLGSVFAISELLQLIFNPNLWVFSQILSQIKAIT